MAHDTPTPCSRTLRLRSRAIALGGIVALSACSDDKPDSEADTLPASLKADLQATVARAVDDQVTPGAVLHVESGSSGDAWSTAVGVSDLELGLAMTPGHHFRAGSIAKTTVAITVLQAVEAGKLALDDALSERLPPNITARIHGAADIDLRMLLGHRSGIADWPTQPELEAVLADPMRVWPLEEILDSVAAQTSMFEPGTAFGYSNTNYILLGEILSRVEGRGWRDVVSQRVFERAGLTSTSLPRVGDPECPEPCAHGYIAVDGQMLDFTRADPSMAGASGGHALITSAADLTRLLRELRSGDLFDRPATLDAMFQLQPAIDPEGHFTRYGLGIMQLEQDGEITIGHLGGTAGYQSFMLYAPATDRYMSGSINVLGDLAAVLEPLIARLAQP